MMQNPIHMYIVIWLIASLLIIIFCYGLVRWSMQKIPRKVHEKLEVREKARSFIDRRSGVDRRKEHDIDYFLEKLILVYVSFQYQKYLSKDYLQSLGVLDLLPYLVHLSQLFYYQKEVNDLD